VVEPRREHIEGTSRPERQADVPALPEVCFRTVRRSHRLLAPIAHQYFRSEVRGMGRLPAERGIVVTHHDGGVLPLNGVCFGVAWYEHFDFGRPLYVLAHDLIHAAFQPFTDLLPRSGVVRADRPVMDRVLCEGHSVLVFPGAARESFRPFTERKRIDLGGRTGFVRQALRHRVPIVPFVSAGSHETFFVLRRGARLARWLRVGRLVRSGDVLPVCLGLPWGVWILPALPQLPLPAKITSEVLEPIELSGQPDDERAVERGFTIVLGRMQDALDRLYAERRYPVFG
jgi:1-acyl-sn-glycerol-3-phosphate acyltransferase